MSRENVELFYEVVEAFNREDLRRLAELSDDDFEFVSVVTAVDADGATYRGPTAWDDYFAEMRQAWDGWQVKDVKAFDAGADRVAAVFRIVGRGKSSGAVVEREVGITYRFRQGRVWRMRSFLDPKEALEAVGLRE
jgi:ketosteroid isomerase-like protein